MLFYKLIGESFIFAIHAIVANKTRTILTLIGITIGIFCIISIFTFFDSIERRIKNSVETLGSNLIIIEKWPWASGSDYPWWRYWRRPEPQLHEMEELNRRSQTIESSAFLVGAQREISFLANTIEGARVIGVSHDYDKVFPMQIANGRYFTPIESASGHNVAIIGDEIKNNLFGNLDPIGRQIVIWGRKFTVIGVIKREGQGTFGNSSDDQVFVPVNMARTFIDLNRGNTGSQIAVRAKPNISNEEMIAEVSGIMRSIRRLKPTVEDNFAINETSFITQSFESVFAVINLVGWIIGGFSLLVGGFGIANIMFVSVKERTGIIGIQKSVGAKNYVILFQFLFEAIFLSVFGGILGLIIIFAGTMILSNLLDMELVLTAGNIFLGVFVSAIIGLLSGIIPAWSASRLDPVEAMRTAI